MGNKVLNEIIKTGLFTQKFENEILYRELVYNLSQKLEGFKLVSPAKQIDGKEVPFKNQTNKIIELKLENNNRIYSFCVEQQDLRELDYLDWDKKEIGIGAYLYSDDKILDDETFQKCFNLFVSKKFLLIDSGKIKGKKNIREGMFMGAVEQEMNYALSIDILEKDAIKEFYNIANKFSRTIPLHNSTLFINRKKIVGYAANTKHLFFHVQPNQYCCNFIEVSEEEKYLEQNKIPLKSTITETKDDFIENYLLKEKKKTK